MRLVSGGREKFGEGEFVCFLSFLSHIVYLTFVLGDGDENERCEGEFRGGEMKG
jgi:hypothetical protein